MRLRPFLPKQDYDSVKDWISDEYTYALWSAGLIEYPLSCEGLNELMERLAAERGDHPFIVEEDDGTPVGFFFYATVLSENEGKLRFIMVDPTKRGRGIGRRMLKLAAKYSFEIAGADALSMNVFSVNERAKRCYESAGFRERSFTENAFTYHGENWGRYNMVLYRE